MKRLLIVSSLAVICLALVGCGAEAAVGSTATAVSQDQEQATASSTPIISGLVEPTPTASLPLETPVPAANAPDHPCLACHSDQQRLIDTAKPEEEVTSENKGEG